MQGPHKNPHSGRCNGGMEKMTDAEFLDEYVEQMIAILEDALKHDGAAPPVAEDARALNIRKAIIANIENVERWKQIRLGSDPEQFKASHVALMSKSAEVRANLETHLNMCRAWYSIHYPCPYCGEPDERAQRPPVLL
jgi:hypothetical protein